MKPPFRTVIADDHPIVAAGLAQLLAGTCTVVATVGDGAELVKATLRLRPQLVLTDIEMPGRWGIEAIGTIVRLAPSVRILVVSMHDHASMVAESLRAGASGYALKDSPGTELNQAVLDVTEGRRFISPRIDAARVEALLSHAQPTLRLSPRQSEILQQVAAGRSMKKAALEMGISPRTAESHKHQLMVALGADSIPDLVQRAIRLGLIHR